MQKFRQQKSFLSAAVDSDRKNNGGSGKGKQLMPNIQNSNKLSLSNQNHDSRNKGARKEGAVPGVEIMHEIKDDSLNGTISPLSLEVSLSLECGQNGKWEIKCSNIKEVGCVSPFGVGPMQAVFRPNVLTKAIPLNPPHVHKFKPKPTLVWQPKRKELTTKSFLMGETQPPGKSSSCPSVLACSAIDTLSTDVMVEPIMPLMSLTVFDVAAA